MPRTTGTRPPGTNRSRARNNPKTRSLNAFSIAQSTTTDKPSIPSRRLGQAPSKKHKARKQDSDDDDSDEGAGGRSRRGRGGDESDVDGGSDSDGGHWKVGVDSDDESDIDSDEAMGESDEERFADFAFRGSSSTGRAKKDKGRSGKGITLDESEDDDDDEVEDEDEEDGEGFVDLSDMLDRATPSDSEPEDDDDEKVKKTTGKKQQQTKSKKRAAPESESEEEEESDNGLDLEESVSEDDDDEEPSDGDDSDTDSFAHFSEEDDTPEDPAKLEALRSLITALPSGSSKHAAKRVRLDDPNEGKTPNEYNLTLNGDSQKLTLADLIPTIADPKLKKSLKVLDDTTTPAGTKSTGIQGRLSAPLAKRQQDRIDRAAAYVKTNETLGRWVDTVKMNREADHLHFPLPNAPNAPIQAPKRLLSIATATGRAPLTALEETISGILKESNMQSERKIAEFEELKTNKLSIEEVQKRTAELRMARELLYREELKAKRIKKIKSKAYHRVHKKERVRQEQAIEEALALERGGVVDEEEMMERERRRAEERMTLRHKQSKWAKGMKESGRSVWDDEAQDGAIEMARRAEELTRRIKGKDVRGEGEEFGESSSSEEDEDDNAFDKEGVELRKKLMKDIEKAEASLGVSSSGSKLGGRLMGMKFMQNAEAAKKKENDAQLEELKNSLMDGDRLSGVEDEEDEEPKQASGRMKFKPGKKEKPAAFSKATHKSEFEEQDFSGQEQDDEEGDEEEDEEVTIVNKANSAASSTVKNPFTAPPRTTAGPAGGKHLSFGARSADDDQTPAGGNPWLPQDAAVPYIKPKQLTLASGKIESKTERSSKKLSKAKKAAGLKNGDDAGEVEIDTSVTLKLAPKTVAVPHDDEDEEVDDKDISLIPANKGGKAARSQRALVKRAFAGDDVVMDFVNEKNAVVEEEGDQVVDESVPGWGSWIGEGVKPRNPDQPNRFLKTVKGIAKDKRKDARLAKVIINEKRVKKNVKYHASALPHMFETKQQYERSLRVPIGPEWTTKATFQDSTMPRVMVKKGVVVEAISAPFK
ncbi:uncharacterized protein LAJ45_10870 [Morchella importuna]|uniref:uncharacterized protein n=1 Tax=Morchella importuna TaxID=1174673 RepID=UPI001E8D1A4C|nr:uncharacterized protein LAJ45_10870 [Morchella importuna]KAH8145090.1 hypothetical protein LAJ45_10870 [Morchella importuna]